MGIPTSIVVNASDVALLNARNQVVCLDDVNITELEAQPQPVYWFKFKVLALSTNAPEAVGQAFTVRCDMNTGQGRTGFKSIARLFPVNSDIMDFVGTSTMFTADCVENEGKDGRVWPNIYNISNVTKEQKAEIVALPEFLDLQFQE